MVNRMLAIALLSVGMLAMKESANFWRNVLDSELNPSSGTLPESRLFAISSSFVAVYSSPEKGETFQTVQAEKVGMTIHSCKDELGIEWRFVALQKENSLYYMGWIEAEALTSLALSEAPAEWVHVHDAWGW